MLNRIKSALWYQSDKNYIISADDSLIIKGFAICLMLWHHVMDKIHDYNVFVSALQGFGKVCVGIFLFLSAYGLTIQQDRKHNSTTDFTSPAGLLTFYVKRLLKLYSNYWVVFIISVPIGVIVFKRALSIPYGNDHLVQSLIADFFGLMGEDSYNATWWFYRLIITLYILFPILFVTMKKWNVYVLGLCFSLFIFPESLSAILPEIISSNIQEWLFHFALGISVALNRNRINLFLQNINKTRLLFITVYMTVIAVVCRSMPGLLSSTKADSFLAPLLSLLSILTVRNIKGLNTFFGYLGKHSMNIFMVHTFIYYYYFSDFIYSLNHPVFIFTVLLSISLAISILLELGKEKLGFETLIKRIDRINFS